MSTSAAIQAVTSTLRNVLAPVTQVVTAGALDRVRSSSSAAQLNLFLYEVVPNGAMRNMEPPTGRGGHGLHPPLALDLRYLLTAFGSTEDDDGDAHGLLGEAMRILHDNAVLATADLENALAAAGVHQQCERVRLTPVHLPADEVSKLWTAFQTNYRLSVAYQASVVLIDTADPGRAALPVLRRGRHAPDDAGRDQGVVVWSGSAPELHGISVKAWRGNQSLPARTGDRLVIEGAHLAADVVDAVFRHPRLASPDGVIVAAGAESDDNHVVVDLPAAIPAGFATVAVRLGRGTDPPLVSNTLALPVATRLGPIVKQPQPGGVTLVVPADRLADGQAVVALIGDRQVAAVQPVQAGVDLAFEVTPPPVAATFVVRVRVDGVDSIPLPDPSADEAVPLPTAFDPAQQVALP